VSDNNISKYEDARAPNLVDVARDIKNWASCHIRMATTEGWCYCKFFEVVKV
jgi:hypothetical protein